MIMTGSSSLDKEFHTKTVWSRLKWLVYCQRNRNLRCLKLTNMLRVRCRRLLHISFGIREYKNIVISDELNVVYNLKLSKLHFK